MVGLAMPNSRFNKFNLVFLFNQLVMKKKAYITPITTITPLPYMEAMLDSSESIGDESLGTPVYMMPNNPFRKPERKNTVGIPLKSNHKKQWKLCRNQQSRLPTSNKGSTELRFCRAFFMEKKNAK